jgi:cytochrome oxidase Cu insertion factor (SCO1/SenC/PrrC family)/ABC-type Zn2+ transport system substrate-binding protein/surface adhesin
MHELFHKMRYLPLVILLVAFEAAATEKFSVVVSIKPIHSLVAGLMKDVAVPGLLIDQGDKPFEFVLGEQGKQLLREASLVIWVGQELERSLQKTIKALPQDSQVMELLASQRLKILPSRHDLDTRDPYFWLDDRNMLILLDEIVEKLIELDPVRSHIYSRNHRELLKPLLKIDKEYEYGYRGMKAGLGVQYYDVLQYFEQAYALNNLGAVGATPYQDVGAVKLLNVGRVIRNNQAACLFIDKSMPADHVDLLTSGTSINIGELDVFGLQFEAGPELYLKLMQYNTDVIKRCLNADMEAASAARQQATSVKFPATGEIGGRFILSDHLGMTFTEQDMKGSYALIFFGYTSCPDICPTSLMVLSQAFSQLDEDIKKQVKPYFISVDPERDSVDVIKEYVNYFTPELVGLTGSKQMIRRVADQFKAKYEKVETDSSEPGFYNMDHTSSLFMMGPDGRFITKFANGITPDELVRQLNSIVH